MLRWSQNATARASLRALWQALAVALAGSIATMALAQSTAGAASSAPCASGHMSTVSSSVKAMDNAVICLINQQRIGHGLPAVRLSWRLTRGAQRWTDQMVATRDYSHGYNFAGRIRSTGYSLLSAGEAIDTGLATPMGVVAAWMHSTPHCQIILYPAFRDIGIGESPESAFGPVGPPGTWTLDLGLTTTEQPFSHNPRPAGGCPYRLVG